MSIKTEIEWFSVDKFMPPIEEMVILRYVADDTDWYISGRLEPREIDQDLGMFSIFSYGIEKTKDIQNAIVTHWCKVPEFEE